MTDESNGPHRDASSDDGDEQSANEPGAATTDGANRTTAAETSTRSDAGEGFDPTSEGARTIGRGMFEEEMGPGSAMAHLYRGEIHRMKLWRERLDRTTNWAVIVMGAILTWAFSSEGNPHYIILIGMATVGVFLTIEARRYRAYDIWRSRVRTMQENAFAHALDPSIEVPDVTWRVKLSRDYRTPTIAITAEEAIAHRLRRVYLPLFTVLVLAWAIRISEFSLQTWPTSAAIGSIPGLAVSATVAGAFLLLVIVAARPRTWHGFGELRTEDLRKHRDG